MKIWPGRVRYGVVWCCAAVLGGLRYGGVKHGAFWHSGHDPLFDILLNILTDGVRFGVVRFCVARPSIVWRGKALSCEVRYGTAGRSRCMLFLKIIKKQGTVRLGDVG